MMYSVRKRNLHRVKTGEKYTCFNIINWIYSILNMQYIYIHMALCSYNVLEFIQNGFCQFDKIIKVHMDP